MNPTVEHSDDKFSIALWLDDFDSTAEMADILAEVIKAVEQIDGSKISKFVYSTPQSRKEIT